MHLLARSDSSSSTSDELAEYKAHEPFAPAATILELRFMGFQVGELVTFCLLGFAILLTCSVVVYYKCIAPSLEARSRVIVYTQNVRFAKYGELFGRFVARKQPL